jgi:hypothetical protein
LLKARSGRFTRGRARVRAARIEDRVAFTVARNEPRVVQHLQVMAQGGLRHVEHVAELEHAERIRAQHPENGRPQAVAGRTRERDETVESGRGGGRGLAQECWSVKRAAL